MDFTQKIIDKQHEVQELYRSEAAGKTLEKETDDEETQPEMEIPPPEDPDEEWLVLLFGLSCPVFLDNCMRKLLSKVCRVPPFFFFFLVNTH